MDINRNNYEEYFLLYADNELTDSEKVEVIMFLKQNKDLEQEFRMIHYTISRPDASVKLANKSFLLRENKTSCINEKNYEEIFVLYHDNELTEIERLETEEFLLQHTELKSEFDLIGLARLTPENSVIFPNKKKLYKKEKHGKVVPVMFWRGLVAAVFIGSGLWITVLYIQKGEEKPAVTVQSVPAKQTSPAMEKKVLPGKKQADAVAQLPGEGSQHSTAGIKRKKEKFQKPLQQKNTNDPAVAKMTVKIQKPNDEISTTESPLKTGNETVIANQQIKNISGEQIASHNAIERPKEVAKNAIQTDVNVQPVMYFQKSSDVSDANDHGQNYVFYDITTEEFKKTKVGGFLKKVKRVIERNNPISRLISAEERQVASN